MAWRSVVFSVVYSVLVGVGVSYPSTHTMKLEDSGLSEIRPLVIAYNSMMFAVVVLLALDVATLWYLVSSGSVAAAAAAVASTGATVVVYSAKTVWMVINHWQPAVTSRLTSEGLGWATWVYLLLAILILTAKTASVLILVKILSKLRRSELNLTGALLADPLLLGVPVARPVHAVGVLVARGA